MPDPHPSLTYTTIQPPLSTYPHLASNNTHPGTPHVTLDRLHIRELCESWPLYRDAAEWKNYAAMFHPWAYITTSWTQGPLSHFIASSKQGFEQQAPHGPFPYILHRVNGQAVDVQGDRAVSKMKVTITCRILMDGVEMDNEAECRFFFLLSKRVSVPEGEEGKGDGKEEPRWAADFMTLLFDKDKFVPVVPGKTFNVPEEEVLQYPSGYRYLAWAESKSIFQVHVVCEGLCANDDDNVQAKLEDPRRWILMRMDLSGIFCMQSVRIGWREGRSGRTLRGMMLWSIRYL